MPPVFAPSKPATSGLTTHVVTTTDGLLGLREPWTRLFEQNPRANPFARFEWTVNWWLAFGRTAGWTRDRLFVLVHNDRNGTTHGITPLVSTTCGKGALRITKLRNAGSVPGANLTEVAPYLWAADRPHQVAVALSHALYNHRHVVDWIELSGIPLDTAFGQALVETPVGAHAAWQQPVPYFPIALPADWPSLRARLSRNAREYIRQVDKRLQRLLDQGHQVDFQLEDRAERMREALEDFFRLHRARSWLVLDERDTRYHPDQFRDEASRKFLHALASDIAPASAFIVARLLIDREVVASRILLRANDQLFFYFSGFDPLWSRHKVMAMLTTECVRAALENPNVASINLSTHVDRSKLLWAPERDHLLGSMRFASPTFRGHWLDRLLRNYRQFVPGSSRNQ